MAADDERKSDALVQLNGGKIDMNKQVKVSLAALFEVNNNEKILVETFRNKYYAAQYVNQVREFMIDSQDRVFDIQEYEFVLPGSE